MHRENSALQAAEPMLDVCAVALRLDVATKTVRRMISHGLLPIHRVGKLIRISEIDLSAYLATVRNP